MLIVRMIQIHDEMGFGGLISIFSVSIIEVVCNASLSPTF